MNYIELMTNLIGWGILLILFAVYMKKEAQNNYEIKGPTGWKALIVTIVGVFSFSINLPIYETNVQLAILPLGVWILYAVLSGRKRWNVYRKYAWLGFVANYIFFAMTLLSIGIYQLVFPVDRISTFVGNIQQPELIITHPSGGEQVTINEKVLHDILSNMKATEMDSWRWYDESQPIIEDDEEGNTPSAEKFPYVLTGTSSKAGSGTDPLIFVENDGKGLLILTGNNHYYFRANTSFLNGLKEDTLQ